MDVIEQEAPDIGPQRKASEDVHPSGSAPLPWVGMFLVLASILGLVFVFVTPMLRGNDEEAHSVRVALILNGYSIPPTSSVRPDGYRVDDCLSAYISRLSRRRLRDKPATWSAQFRNPPCAPVRDTSRAALPANVYSPVPYVPALAGFRVGRALGGAWGSLYGARLFQLAAFIALMALAIHWTPWGKALLFTIGMLPTTLQVASGISADPMTLALVCCTAALVLRLIAARRSATVRETVALGVIVVALALSKSAYLPFALLVLALPTVAFENRRRRVAISGGILAVAAVLGGAWSLGVVQRLNLSYSNLVQSLDAAAVIRSHPLGFFASIARGWTFPGEARAVIEGMVIPYRVGVPHSLVPIWVIAVGLIIARLVDPVPRVLRRLPTPRRRRASHASRNASAGELGAPVDTEAAGSSLDAARPGPVSDRPDVAGGVSVAALVMAGIVAVACFILIEYGIAIAANPPGSPHIRWLQGRYLLPLLPLSLFAVRSGPETVPRRWLWVIPVVTTAAVAWWIWWASKNLWWTSGW